MVARKITSPALVLVWMMVGSTVVAQETFDALELLPPAERASALAISEVVTERFEANPGARHILLISGGGPKGAFGTGYLRGWRDSGSGLNRMPEEFDVVTGISVGALMATHVYLGDDHLDELYDLMADTEAKDVYNSRFFLFLPFSTGLSSYKRLARYVEHALPEELIDEVARVSGDSKRGLFVGAVDLVTGDTIPYDLGELAREGRYEDYRDAVVASALSPVGYSVMRKGDQVLTDGGVREIVLLRDFMIGLGIASSLKPVTAQLEENAVPTTVWVLMNQSFEVARKEDVGKGPAPLLGVIKRDVELLTDASFIGNLNYVYILAWAAKAEFRLASMPRNVDVSLTGFTKDDMREMLKRGEAEGRKPHSWMDRPPDYERIRKLSELLQSILDGSTN